MYQIVRASGPVALDDGGGDELMEIVLGFSGLVDLRHVIRKVDLLGQSVALVRHHYSHHPRNQQCCVSLRLHGWLFDVERRRSPCELQGSRPLVDYLGSLLIRLVTVIRC